jgi:hypothetical protein
MDEDRAHMFLKWKEVKKLWQLAGLDELREHMSSYWERRCINSGDSCLERREEDFSLLHALAVVDKEG